MEMMEDTSDKRVPAGSEEDQLEQEVIRANKSQEQLPVLLPIIVTSNLPNQHFIPTTTQPKQYNNTVQSTNQQIINTTNLHNNDRLSLETNYISSQAQQQLQQQQPGGAAADQQASSCIQCLSQGAPLNANQIAIDWLSWEILEPKSGQVLATGQHQIDNEPSKLAQALDDLQNELKGKPFLPITCGPLSLRQHLFPAAYRSQLELAPHFNRYLDLHDEQLIATLCDDLSSQLAGSAGSLHNEMKFMRQMIVHLLSLKGDHLSMTSSNHQIIRRQLDHYDPNGGASDRNSTGTFPIPDGTVVRARGLPWQATERDIGHFFVGLDIPKGGIALCLSKQGRRNGEALIRFESQQHRQLALARHKHYMGARYIEIYRATGADFTSTIAGYDCKAQALLSRGSHAMVRLRGLPFNCSARQVLEFFAPKTGHPAEASIEGNEEGVLFIRNQDDKPTGDAFVFFTSEDAAQRALQRHHCNIGQRYVDLFRSNVAELQQALCCFNEHPSLFNQSRPIAKSIETNRRPQQQQPLQLQAEQKCNLVSSSQVDASDRLKHVELAENQNKQESIPRRVPVITYAQVATKNNDQNPKKIPQDDSGSESQSHKSSKICVEEKIGEQLIGKLVPDLDQLKLDDFRKADNSTNGDASNKSDEGFSSSSGSEENQSGSSANVSPTPQMGEVSSRGSSMTRHDNNSDNDLKPDFTSRSAMRPNHRRHIGHHHQYNHHHVHNQMNHQPSQHQQLYNPTRQVNPNYTIGHQHMPFHPQQYQTMLPMTAAYYGGYNPTQMHHPGQAYQHQPFTGPQNQQPNPNQYNQHQIRTPTSNTNQPNISPTSYPNQPYYVSNYQNPNFHNNIMYYVVYL